MDDREHQPVDLPPWELPVFNVSYSAIKVKKCNVPCELMRQDFLSRLNALPECPNILYTDGSLHEDGRTGAGVVYYKGESRGEHRALSIRMSDGCSSTQTELLGIAAALAAVKREARDIIIASDSTTALQSITSRNLLHTVLVNRIIKLVYKITCQDKTVNFIWSPSHCGKAGNERADELANSTTTKDGVEFPLPLSLGRLKTEMCAKMETYNKRHIDSMLGQSVSLTTYMDLTKGCQPHYIQNGLITSRQQVCYSRLRLGYKYMWEVAGSDNINMKKCNLCKTEEKHTLRHYVMECQEMIFFRSSCANASYAGLLHYYLQPCNLIQVKNSHPSFANAS
ncbi:Gag-Pol polyprotein [Chionoecetes opilio]|uniref:Gag-Pol polyprotein n=1 Tax=Chionoecetes opilio TaxID=41210 RepID=A0A8J4YDL4_CHIOP|nr:Gag-Pol polyprotein [Chionoecetes opilio]